MRNESKRLEIHRPHLPFLMFICVASALGGLLWGFDAIVISGTINPVKLKFALSPGWEGFFVSSGLLGAVIGSALSGWLSDRFGRSRNLLLAAVLLWLSALGSALANSIGFLAFARWVGGLGVGISAMVCPLYISEISPTHLRGRLVTTFQFAITLGIMIALFNNFGLHQWAASLSESAAEGSFIKWFVVDETWRAMFASELVPGMVFLVMAAMLPERGERRTGGNYRDGGSGGRRPETVFRCLSAALPQTTDHRHVARRVCAVQWDQCGLLLWHLYA
jgi:SP family arabinose:H+ symporter-like MFS transporter